MCCMVTLPLRVLDKVSETFSPLEAGCIRMY